MQNGTTYMVRPRMEPEKCSSISSFSAAGFIQLLVGPASSSFSVEMKVRDSTRATSEGWERARNELGRFSSFSLVSVPASTSSAVRRSHSSREPSAKTTLSGSKRSTASLIQAMSCSLSVGLCPSRRVISAVIGTPCSTGYGQCAYEIHRCCGLRVSKRAFIWLKVSTIRALPDITSMAKHDL